MKRFGWEYHQGHKRLVYMTKNLEKQSFNSSECSTFQVNSFYRVTYGSESWTRMTERKLVPLSFGVG